MIETPGSCRITMRELIDLPEALMSLNPLLIVAAKRGCPVEGVIFPQMVPGVKYTRTYYSDEDAIEIRWKKCEACNGKGYYLIGTDELTCRECQPRR
jgi:hypothetical protein